MFTTAMLLMLIIGIVTVPLAMGANAWFKDLGFHMTTWKWVLTGLWYFLLLFCIYLDFTFMGEGEVAAGWKMLLFQMVVLLVFAVGLYRILKTKGKK